MQRAAQLLPMLRGVIDPRRRTGEATEQFLRPGRRQAACSDRHWKRLSGRIFDWNPAPIFDTASGEWRVAG